MRVGTASVGDLGVMLRSLPCALLCVSSSAVWPTERSQKERFCHESMSPALTLGTMTQLTSALGRQPCQAA